MIIKNLKFALLSVLVVLSAQTSLCIPDSIENMLRGVESNSFFTSILMTYPELFQAENISYERLKKISAQMKNSDLRDLLALFTGGELQNWKNDIEKMQDLNPEKAKQHLEYLKRLELLIAFSPRKRIVASSKIEISIAFTCRALF